MRGSPHLSLWAWAAVTAALGLTLALAPQAAANLAAVPLPDGAAPWARLAGLMTLAYSLAYGVAAAFDLVPWMWASVALRGTSLAPIGALVGTGLLPSPMLAIGVADLAGALWTWRELAARARRDNEIQTPGKSR
ncbi:MAG: hypothetical protein U1F48_16720 [Burkholderiales bacterium]